MGYFLYRFDLIEKRKEHTPPSITLSRDHLQRLLTSLSDHPFKRPSTPLDIALVHITLSSTHPSERQPQRTPSIVTTHPYPQGETSSIASPKSTEPNLAAGGQQISQMGGLGGSRAHRLEYRFWLVLAIGAGAVGSFMAVVVFAVGQYRKVR